MIKSIAIAMAAAVLMPFAASAGFTQSDTISAGDVGKSLQNGKVYVVSENTTIERPSDSANSALYVANGATAVIYIPKNVTLTVKGGGANGTTGGGAGIEVPENSTLIITGRGSIVAKGGNAANGAAGSSGDSGYIVDDNDSSRDEWGHAGAGGNGGNGGGGAGAGIGGHGGEGGSGGSGGYWTWYDTRQNFDHNGTGGDDGSKGGDSYSGTIYILGSIFANATGGSGGSAGGSAGSTGSVDVEHWGLSAYAYRACGGGGGGGGGAGDWAYGYGRGGYGGGGGGGGGGGATYQASWATDDDNSRGGCGGGGSGYVNGSGSQENGVSHWDVTGGNGGYGASHGSDSPNTWTYRGPGTSVAGDGYFSTAYTHYSIEYTLTFSDEWRTNEIHEVKLGYAMPAAPVLPARNRYVFKGWYSGDTCYYDENGASLRTEYDHVGNLTLNAKWQLEDSTAAITVNGAGIIPGASSSGEGWNYDSASGILTLSASSAYSISGSSLDGEIVIRAAPPSTGFCILTLDGVSIDSGNRSGVAAFTLAEHSYVMVNTSSHSSFSSAAGFPGIMLESDARIVLAGQGALVATGGKGARDIGFASGITDYGKIFIAASAVDFHPGAGRLPGVVGGNGGIYLFQTGDPPRLWAVSVPGFEPGAAVAWSGLASAYSSEYSTADENGKAWLWLPDGTYNFKSTSGGVEKSWDARVNGEHREAREHIETGLLVNGEDIACLARPGWYWNETGMLYITNAGPFTVKGSTKKIAISVDADSTLKLDTSLDIDFSSASQVSPISVKSGVSLRLELLEGCQANLKAGVEAAAVSVPEGSTLTIAGAGALTAQGGKRAAGIGSNKDIKCGKMRIEGGRISAYGGSYSPGIGVGDSGSVGALSSGELEIAGGTVYAHRSHGQSSGSSCDIGSSDFEDFKSVKITGGSVSPYNGLIDPHPVNGAGEKLYMVTVGGFEPQSPVAGVEIPTAPLYGFDGVLADDQGNIYIWLPNGTHYIFIDGVAYVVDVEGAPATPRLWESALAIDGEPLVELGCKGWRYDFASETVVFTNSQTFVVSGSTTNEVLSAGVDCVLIASNLTVDATYDTGKAPFTAAAGKTLTIAGGTMSALGGADGLTGGKVLIKGGSLHTGFEAFGRRPVNVADEAVYMVTVEGFDPGARIVSITRESEYVKDVHDYATEAMFADGDGKIYIWLSSGRYDFMVGVEKGGSVEAVEYIAWVDDADATAVEYQDSGLLVDGRDAAHGAGPGWHSDVTNQVSLAEARTFCVSGETEVMGVLAAEDLTVVVSNLVINGTRVAETAPFTVAEGRNVRLETVETNKFYATVPSAAVYVQKNATVTLDGEGVLYAYGGEGGDKSSAAIGSGFRQECGKVVIAGGEVHAISRTYTTPGIGVGETYNLAMKLGGEFEIAGGLVFVSGGKYAADIGPAQHTECGSVTITGGTVLKEDFQSAETLVKIGKSSIESASKLVIGGGSVVANTASVYPAATNALGNAVYPVTVEGFQPLASCRVRCQFEYGDKDVFADREGKLHLWFPKGWNYFLVDGEPYRANIVYDWAEAAQWLSGVYIDGIDAAYVTMGAWKLVDLNIDLTNAAPYSIHGSTSEFTMRAKANLTANLTGLEITRAADTSSPAFLVAGPIDVTMTLAATNTMSGGNRCAAVQVEDGGRLRVTGDGWLVAKGGSEAAGIGGGQDMSNGEVAIDSGHVEATGGAKGAGIGSGSGSGSTGYTLNIYGGEITAKGGESAAGIGGGKDGRNIAINITGGEIAAVGGQYGAGIGCGDSNTASQKNVSISITGGRVTATSGEGGAAIGASPWGSCEAITISGGTVFPLTASGAEGLIGSGSSHGQATSVKFIGGAIYTATNCVSPAALNNLNQNLFPLDLDVETANGKVADITFGINYLGYYGKKDLYANADGILRVWLPSTTGVALTVNITMEDGEKFVFCVTIDDEGKITQIDFIAVNGKIITSDKSDSGDEWSYRSDTKVLTLTGDAQLDGISTNGAFHVLVPEGGAENVILHRLTLTAMSQKNSSAIVIQNDVVMTVSRSNTVTAVGKNSVGIEVAKDASLVLSGDGKLVVRGGDYAAGIGSNGLRISANEPGMPGTMTILSGEITAFGGANAAGIGGGKDNTLQQDGIRICGGVVRAYGGINAAGVGAGNGSVRIPDGAVVVEGGTVLAWGGNNPRQTGGFGGSKSWSDFIKSLGNMLSVSGTDLSLVVKGGTVVPETAEIDYVSPRPVNASDVKLYSITFVNLPANSPVELSCEDFPADFGLNDIYSDDDGRVKIWLAPTNHARVVSVNGKYFTTEYPYENSAQSSVYEDDVVVDCGSGGSDEPPGSMDMGGDKLWRVTVPGLDPSAAVTLELTNGYQTVTDKADAGGNFYFYIADGQYVFKANGNNYAVEVDGHDALASAVSKAANPSVKSISITSTSVVITVSSDNPYVDWSTIKIYRSPTLPVTEASEQIDLSLYPPVDNGDGTATVTVLLSSSDNMFYLVK